MVLNAVQLHNLVAGTLRPSPLRTPHLQKTSTACTYYRSISTELENQCNITSSEHDLRLFTIFIVHKRRLIVHVDSTPCGNVLLIFCPKAITLNGPA